MLPLQAVTTADISRCVACSLLPLYIALALHVSHEATQQEDTARFAEAETETAEMEVVLYSLYIYMRVQGGGCGHYRPTLPSRVHAWILATAQVSGSAEEPLAEVPVPAPVTPTKGTPRTPTKQVAQAPTSMSE